METPDVNQPVLLRAPDGSEYPSRVEGLDDGVLTLARPFELPLDTDLDDGSPFDLMWTTATGLFERPARVTERAVDGRIRVWHAEPVGPVRRTNRREHVRVPVAVPMTIRYADAALPASLADLSEAALRCHLERRLVTGDLPEQVQVGFTVAEASFDLPGTVYRSTPKGDAVELVITLPTDGATATALRRAVFTEQVRARQRS